MSDTQQQSSDNESDHQDDEDIAAAGANDNSEEISADEKKLNSLYERLPKVLSRITADNEKENIVALNSLLKSFKIINELEKKLSDENDSYEPISLLRIYELAVSGGGSETDLEELTAANEAFAQENEILVDTIESLNFELGRLRKQAADEILNLEKGHKPPMEDLKKGLAQVENTLSKVQKQIGIISGGQEGGSDDQPLDERLAQSIADLEDISADHLRSAPSKVSIFGKMLRKAGFAYDYKDMITVRELLKAFTSANKKLSEINTILIPAQEQIKSLHHVLSLLELYAGHDEREGPQYVEALEEIERLKKRLSSYEQRHAELEELEREIADERHRYLQAISAHTEQLDDLKEQIENAKQYHEILLKDIDELDNRKNSDDEAHQEQSDTELSEEDKAQQELEAEVKKQEMELELEAQKAKAEFEKIRAEQEMNMRAEAAQAKTLREELSDLKEKYEEDIENLQIEHKGNIAYLKNKMRAIEGGWLVEKLEAEIISLREAPEKLRAQLETEKEARKAFEERVGIWVKDSEKLEKEAGKWRKRAGIKHVFALSSAALTVAGTYFAAAHLIRPGTLGWGFAAATMIVPTVLAALFNGIRKWDAQPHGAATKKDFWRGAKFGAITGGILSGMSAGAALIYIYEQSDQWSAREIADACRGEPCQIANDIFSGSILVPHSEIYEGKIVTLDYTDPNNPKIIVKDPKAQPEPQLKGAW